MTPCRPLLVGLMAMLVAGCAVTDRPVVRDAAAPSNRPSPTQAPSQRSSQPAPEAPSLGWGQRPRPWARGKDLERLPTSEKVVALTVDAGANADAIDSILASLSAAHVPATFFLTGAWARTYPDKARAVVRAGHVVGQHSFSHSAFTQLSDAEIRSELDRAETQLAPLLGRTSRPLFRFPSGDRDARTIAAVNERGYCAVRWTVDTLGWKGTSGGTSVATVVDRVMAGLAPGEIVLMHTGSHPSDGSTLDADALPEVIKRIRAAGYGFTTLAAFTR